MSDWTLTTDPNDQIVLTSLGEIIALLTGSREHLEGNT